MITTYHNYFPYQPSFESNSNYQNFIVNYDHPLYGIVTDFYQFSSKDYETENMVDVLPDACCDLFFQIDNHANPKNSLVSVNGTTISRVNINLKDYSTYFGIRFFPGAIKRLFHVNAEELVNNEIPLTELMDETQTSHIISIVQNTATFEKRIQHITEYFLKIIHSQEDIPLVVPYSVYDILEHHGNIRINALAEKTGYSCRYLRKIFTQFVGLSPKEFSEIIRFQSSFIDYSNNVSHSLSDLAAKYGYSDHAQMNKAYIKFTYLPPSMLIKYFSMSTSEIHKTYSSDVDKMSEKEVLL